MGSTVLIRVAANVFNYIVFLNLKSNSKQHVMLFSGVINTSAATFQENCQTCHHRTFITQTCITTYKRATLKSFLKIRLAAQG